MTSLDAPFGVTVFPEIGSTNVEAMRLAALGERGPLWLRAGLQTAGKGRSGRHWVSEPGNLYCSLLITLDCAPEAVAHLSIVAGIAIYDAIVLASDGRPPVGLVLKWPNDVLVDGGKCAGILSEAVRDPKTGEATVVIGIGINLKHAPEDIGREAVSLMQLGIAVEPEEMLVHVDRCLRSGLAIWDGGRGFPALLARWRAVGTAVGQALAVNTGKGVVSGEFRGLAEDGALILKDRDGYEHRVTFGDVSVIRAGKDS